MQPPFKSGVLAGRTVDERQTEQVTIGLRSGPDDPCMLNRFVLRRGPDAQGAYLVERHSAVERDAKPTDARIDRHPRTMARREQLHLRIERPATRATTGPSMQRHVGTTFRQDRGESL